MDDGWERRGSSAGDASGRAPAGGGGRCDHPGRGRGVGRGTARRTLEFGPEEDPAAPVRELLAGATLLRGYRTRNLESTPDVLDLAAGSVDCAELCLSPDLVETLVVEDRNRLQELLDADDICVRELDGTPNFGLLLAEHDEGTPGGVAVLVHDDEGLRGTILTRHPDAVEWARDAVGCRLAAATSLDGP